MDLTRRRLIVVPEFVEEMPLCIRMTMAEVLEAALQAHLRAQMLEWSIERIPSSSGVPRKVRILQDIAIDLRRIAEHLREGWEETT